MEQVAFYKLKQPDGFRLMLSKALSVVLICTGLLTSCYLFYRQLNYSNTNANHGIDVCSTVFGKGCDAALNSQVSMQFGLPLSGWGIIFYSTLLLLFMLLRFRKVGAKPIVVAGISVLIFCGAIISLMLLLLMAVNTSLFCPFCTIIHVINLLLAFLLPLHAGQKLKSIFNKAAFATPTSNLVNKRSAALYALLHIALPVLFAAAVYYALSISLQNGNQISNPVFNAQQFVYNFNKQPVVSIPVYPDDPVKGRDAAPIRIVVFSDFQCPACRYFSKVLSKLESQYENKIQVVFKHFPLGTACNGNVAKDVHPRACEAAWAAEAAAQQNKFWVFHDAVFNTDLDAGDETLCSISQKLQLNHSLFESGRTSSAAKKRVSQTVLLAKQMGIDFTPAVYLNNRLVSDFRLKPMQVLIESCLAGKP